MLLEKSFKMSKAASKTILILGGSGFVGTNLRDFATRTTDHRLICPGHNDCDLLDGDVTKWYISKTRPDVVINLAAFVGGILLNRQYPADMIYRNLVMGANVVEACRLADVQKLIYLGTVCSYPHTPTNIPFVETDLWNGRPEATNEPYGVAKKAIGFMLGAYHKQYNLNSTYLMPTNMYGPHDDFGLESSHVIPALIRKFRDAVKNKESVVTLWGDGSPSRDFMYVGDCCEVILGMVSTDAHPEPINVGSGRETTMTELAAVIGNSLGFTGSIVWDRSKPNGQPRRCLDCTVLDNLLPGDRSRTPLVDGLKTTIGWYLEYGHDNY
jgi:GDP-L-fucose synthase